MSKAQPEREAWDYEAFIRHYNDLAHKHGGWEFDRNGYTPEPKLRAWYEESALYDSLLDFARTRFELEQQV